MGKVSYRIYNNFRGWQLIGIEDKPSKVLSIVENRMKTEKATYLIIEHDHDMDCDTPVKTLYNIEDLPKLEDRLLNTLGGIKKVYKR